MSTPKVLFGFHAVGVRLKTAPASIIEVYVDPTRRDARMKQFLSRAAEAGVRIIEADGPRLFADAPDGEFLLMPAQSARFSGLKALMRQREEALRHTNEARLEAERVLVDLSHAGMKTMAGAIETSKRPLIVSHTACNWPGSCA